VKDMEIEDLTPKEGTSLAEAGEIALALMGKYPDVGEDEAVPGVDTPFPSPPDGCHENAEGKKLCGTCQHKVKLPIWVCIVRLNGLTCPASNGKCPEYLPKTSKRYPTQQKVKGLAKVPPGVVMMYFGREGIMGRYNWSGGHHGIITAAVRVKESPNFIEIGFSFCSPTDPWCKAKGRDLALERLTMNPTVIPYLYKPLAMARLAVKAVALHDWKRLSQFGILAAHLPDQVPGWTKGVTLERKKRPIIKMISGKDFFESLGLHDLAKDLTGPEILNQMKSDIARVEGSK
jgi:hypothetical protein